MNPNANFPEKLNFLFEPHRYKVVKGGRGKGASWGCARALLIMGASRPLRILCARETQKSILDSVHQLLEDQITALELGAHYTVEQATIKGTLNATTFVFAGLKHNIDSIKSAEGIDIVWVEEAQTVSAGSWKKLIPTIRKDGSEIWVTYNPELLADATHQLFAVNPPPDAVVVAMDWRENPWFPAALEKERLHDLATKSTAEYDHIWGGACVSMIEGAIYAHELSVVDRENRITRIPYDRARVVDCYWDLGYGDKCAIWFVQAFPFQWRLIDFLQNDRKPITWYLTEMQHRGYVYGTDYLPWDLGLHAKLLGAGKSIEAIMRDLGRKVRISPRTLKANQIELAREIFPLCWFDRERCADGLQALRHYRYGLVEKTNTTTREPLHDEYSHGADAFAYFALNSKSQIKKPKDVPPPPKGGYHERSWMA
jgi:phage terminase large subunit